MNDQANTEIGTERIQEASEWLQRLADQTEAEEVFLQWQVWCSADPANARAFEQIQELWQRIDPKLIAQIRALDSSRHRRRTLAAAASVLLIFGACATWFAYNSARTQEWRTSVGEVRHETLADGSRLDLGADSHVVVHYSDTQRLLDLRSGRALFTVARETARPFIVRAGDVQVTAIGTAFDIRTAPSITVVTVGEGRVKITQDPLSPSDAVRVVSPVEAETGQRVRYSKSTNELTISRVDPRLSKSWRDGKLQFQEEALQDVVSEVNRYTTRKIVVQDDDIGQAIFTGTISAGRVDDWLASLERILPVTIEDHGAEGIYIEKNHSMLER